MKHLPTALALGLAAAACASSAGLDAAGVSQLAETRAKAAGTGRVEATITGVEAGVGTLGAALFVNSSGFPSGWETAFASDRQPAAEGTVFVFERVPAGELAISVYQDLDDNGQLDTGLLGIPSEPWGVSRGARGRFGPPKFSQARIRLADNQTLRTEVPLEK